MHDGITQSKEKKTIKLQRRGCTFLLLAGKLGITSSSLRRWARRGRIHGAAFVRSRWILRGPLTLARIERIRSGLNLNPKIAKGRQGGNLHPVRLEKKREDASIKAIKMMMMLFPWGHQLRDFGLKRGCSKEVIARAAKKLRSMNMMERWKKGLTNAQLKKTRKEKITKLREKIKEAGKGILFPGSKMFKDTKKMLKRFERLTGKKLSPSQYPFFF